ncbi:MAG TPA: ferritin [Pirellulaceae bacterium]
MLPPVVQKALYDQINLEFHSSYSYLGMAAYCEHVSFTGSAKWFRVQSQEETTHAMKLYDFLLARGCSVELPAIAASATRYESIPHVFRKSLEQEQHVTKSIDRLYELAYQEKAFAALVELQWFIAEQVEEEKTIRDILAKIELIKDDPSAMIDLDRELGTRQLSAGAAAEKTAE